MSLHLTPGNGKYGAHEEQRDSFSIPHISLPVAAEPQAKDDTPERGTYTNSIHSLLLCISMSVGLGNIWRFPNVAYNNGGAAFLIPYLLVLVIIGRPLYYLELIIGQFSSEGPIKVWKCVPAFQGLGYAQLISLSFVTIFYNYLMAISLHYMFSSMQSCLPWSACHYPNVTSNENGTSLIEGLTIPDYYWRNDVIMESGSLEELDSISWQLVLCLLGTWIIVYSSVIRGVDSLGKMSYFTAIFPYVALFALLIVTCMEEGAAEGIKYFFIPQFDKLLDVKVWYKACEQSFFSLAIGFGNIIMIGSYNKFRNNVYRDALVVSGLDTLTNLLAGSVIFAVLGTLSIKYNKPINEVANHEGLDLAFVVYPEALENIKHVPQLWSVLFFFMLFTLGVGSSMSMIETLLTVIKDQFPALRRRKWLLALGICSVFFLLGLPLTTNAGQFILLIINNFGVGAAGFLYAIMELCGFVWIYGLSNLCQDAAFMMNRAVGIFWKVTWVFTAPVSLVIIFVYGMASNSSIPEVEVLPAWGIALGWILAALAIVQIPVWFVYVLYKDPHDMFAKKIQNVFRPSPDWGPSDPVMRSQWKALKTPLSEKMAMNNISPLGPSAYENATFKEDVF